MNEGFRRSPRDERDATLLNAVVNAAIEFKSRYEDWLIDEARDLIVEAETCTALYTDRPDIVEKLQEQIAHVRVVQRDRIKGAVKALDDKITDVEGEAYDDVMDAREYVDEGIKRLEDLVFDLLAVRRSLERLDEPDV